MGKRTRAPSQPFSPVLEARARVAAIRASLENGEIRAVVVGAGRSGRSALELLKSRGARVEVVDDRDPSELAREPALRSTPIGRIESAVFERADLVVLSPGVPRTRPDLMAPIQRGLVVGEIELASWFLKVPLVGITGTNGKSTTTALVAHVFECAGMRTFAGGNLGRPLSDLVTSGEDVDVAVVELSSYQLESIVDARFEVACWLNLTPDHADRYPDLETYAAAKRRIVERRSVNGVAVLNALDPVCSGIGVRLGGPIRWFAADVSSDLAGPAGTVLAGPDRAVRTAGRIEERYDLSNESLPGMHNRANMCAAIECARHLGAPVDAVGRGLRSFKGLPHRIELVGTHRGVRWYNDSKATNVDSVVTALRALSGRKILIAGGKDKGAPWTPLREIAPESVRAVLAIGSSAPIVVQAFRDVVPVVEDVGTIERAVERANEIAVAGDAVLLSPACASFDQFKNYEHRGDTFRALVSRLAGGGGDR